MMLKELIDRLTAAYVTVGNVEVDRSNTCCCYGDWEEPITSVEAVPGGVTLA